MILKDPENAAPTREERLKKARTIAELVQKPMLKVGEAAELLCVNHKTVREMLARGELPHSRLGRAVRIPTRAVLSLTMQDRVMPLRSKSDGGET